MKSNQIAAETKLLYASAIIGIIAAVSPGDNSYNKALIDDIAEAAVAARDLLDQVVEEMEAQQ